MMASVAVRLFTRFIVAVGEVMNCEHPEILRVLQNTNTDSGNVSCTDPSNQSLRDFCVFRSVIKLHSLYRYPPFMNDENDDGINAQINTLHRLSKLC